MTAILGISALYHDAAAALLVDGKIAAAAQQERFSRKKHDSEMPTDAIAYCLKEADIAVGDLDFVGFYDKPLLKLERLLETYQAFAPSGFEQFQSAVPSWLHQKLHIPRELDRALGDDYQKRYVFPEHHESHAASAFFPSGFEEAAILTIDGVGEWATASIGRGRGNRIELTHELRFPHSLGLLYSAFTYYAGFAVNDGEYKLMGLAPYGEPKYEQLILDHLVDLKPDGSLKLDLSYFNYCQGLTMTSEKFHRLFGGAPRAPDAELTQRDMDVAASVQRVTEEVMLRMARHAHELTDSPNLCLAGGVALNCVGNGRVLRETPFRELWIQPAAGDAGGALGAALFIHHQLLEQPRTTSSPDAQARSTLGESFDDDQVESFLQSTRVVYGRADGNDELCEEVVRALVAGEVVGWFQGRMEFGPRALGSRSILADPRRADTQSTLNLKIKFREGFRPFGPVVLAERASELFELEPGQRSPYMLLVAPLRAEHRVAPDDSEPGVARIHQKRSHIPAVTHVDYSARVQTVEPGDGLLRDLLEKFDEETGCPVLVNTSLNLGWTPIARTPEDAYEVFMRSEMDMLVLGSFILKKSEQPAFVSLADDEPGARALGAEPRCPVSGDALQARGSELHCEGCNEGFRVDDGIPQLYVPADTDSSTSKVTTRVKEFYEETPFPNYDEHESVRSLVDKARKGRYARELDAAIPHNSRVLDVGCGTGQLCNFLGLSNRRVVGTDMSLGSLRLAETFRREHGLARVSFLQMNLFRPALAPGRFDVVLCNGVLHHTADPQGGLRRLVELTKPGGHVVLGLYNLYGRLTTDALRLLSRVTGKGALGLDRMSRQLPRAQRPAWIADQYRHPHESSHTFGQVLRWFDDVGLSFVRGVPSLSLDDDELEPGTLFEPSDPRGSLDRAVAQLAMVVSASKEGGYFSMIGKKI